MNDPHKGPVRGKMFPFDDVIMNDMTGNYSSVSIDIYNTVVVLENPHIGQPIARPIGQVMGCLL